MTARTGSTSRPMRDPGRLVPKGPLAALLVLVILAGCTSAPSASPDLYGELNSTDVAIVARLVQRTLETAADGTTRRWVNETSGNAGTITPARTFLSSSGHFCRTYREELMVSDRRGAFENLACRDSTGTWILL